MKKVVTPEEEYIISNEVHDDPSLKGYYLSIFLAGTIDNGESEDWQSKLIDKLKEVNLGGDTVIYNPRRKNWNKDASKEEILGQIAWEQEWLEKSDIIIINLLDDSKSPISLLELGQYAASRKLMVICSDKFYRYDNVKFICDKYYIPLIDTKYFNEIPNIINDICLTRKT